MPANDLIFSYDLQGSKNLISCNKDDDEIYKHDGFTDTVLFTFNAPGSSPSGLGFDGTDLVSCDDFTNKIYIHSGITAIIDSSFAAPSGVSYGLTFDGTDLISCDYSSTEIYVHSLISSTIDTTFATPDSNATSLTYNTNDSDLISCDSVSNKIFVHDGVSVTVSSSFAAPDAIITGLAYSSEHLASSDANTDKIYIHSGISSTITSSFTAPSSASANPNGLTSAYETPLGDLPFSYDINVGDDLAFSYDIKPGGDFTFSYDIEVKGDLLFSYDICVGADLAFIYSIFNISDANIYKTSYCLDAYSIGGSYSDPIFPYPPNSFRGDIGETKDLECWLRNDGDTNLTSLDGLPFILQPLDMDGTDESTWIRLAATQIGLDTAIAGVNLSVPDLAPGETFAFWVRVVVPVDTVAQDKQDLRIRVCAVAEAV